MDATAAIWFYKIKHFVDIPMSEFPYWESESELVAGNSNQYLVIFLCLTINVVSTDTIYTLIWDLLAGIPIKLAQRPAHSFL